MLLKFVLEKLRIRLVSKEKIGVQRKKLKEEK